MSERVFKVGAGLVVSIAALAAIALGYDGFLAPMMDCIYPPR
ncbi:MAG: hypothetical protein ABW128_10905 [Rhizorhabdus sp.]